MCGIATIALGRSEREKIPYDKLRSLVSHLIVELQARGVDASGIAVINEKGKEESVVYKMPLRAERLVVRPAFQSVLGKIGPHTNFIMLHARATTVGSNENSPDNHPILTPNIIGIHNGTLYNHNKLFNEYEDHFPRTGKVDSEIIFRLYSHFVDTGLTPQEALKKTSDLLDGAYTGALVDWRVPSRMLMFKNDRSLCMVRMKHYDTLIAVSEARLLSKAIDETGIKAKSEALYVEDGTGIIVDLNEKEKITDRCHAFRIPINSRFTRFVRNAWSGGVFA